MVTQSPPALVCPVCAEGEMHPTDQVVELPKVLAQWEKQSGIQFPEAVRTEYGMPFDPPITLFRCTACGLGAFLPTLTGSNGFYQAITQAEESYYIADRWEFRRARTQILAQGCKTVLDVGCGTGAFLRSLEADGLTRYGYDFNTSAAEVARDDGLRILPRLAPDMAPAGGFDAVCCFQVLEHVEDPAGFVDTLLSLLRPGGLLVITVPDSLGPVRFFTDAVTDMPPHHVTRWTATAMRKLGHRKGLRQLDICTEPLSSWIWKCYLPVIVDQSRLPGFVKRYLSRNGLVSRLIEMLESRNIHQIPWLDGHTLYTAFTRPV